MICFENLIWLFKQGEETRNIARVNLAEGALLYRYTKMVCSNDTPSTIVEIGRKYGGSTVLLAGALSPNDTLYSIDIEFHRHVNDNLCKCTNLSQIKLLTGDSKKIGQAWDKPIDLIFVDGDHSYKGVKRDIDAWLHHVKPLGYAIFHDVLGKKQELTPLMDELKKENWQETDSADSTLCLQRRTF